MSNITNSPHLYPLSNNFITSNKALLKSVGIAFITGLVIVLTVSHHVKSYMGLLTVVFLFYGGTLLIYIAAAYAIWGLGYFIEKFISRNKNGFKNQQIFSFLYNMLIIIIPIFLTVFISFFMCLGAYFCESE